MAEFNRIVFLFSKNKAHQKRHRNTYKHLREPLVI